MYEVEEALADLWKQLGSGPARGIRLFDPDNGWAGSLWDHGDGVFRGIVAHATRGLFRATKTGDGPVVIEGWALEGANEDDQHPREDHG